MENRTEINYIRGELNEFIEAMAKYGNENKQKIGHIRFDEMSKVENGKVNLFSFMNLNKRVYLQPLPEIKIIYKEENKMEKVLKLWHDNKIMVLDKNLVKDIKEADDNCDKSKNIREKVSELKTLLSEITKQEVENLNINLEVCCHGYVRKLDTRADKTKLAIEVLNEKHKLDCSVYKDKFLTVRLMIDACDTYEQKLAIMNAYNIIDDKGKLVD